MMGLVKRLNLATSKLFQASLFVLSVNLPMIAGARAEIVLADVVVDDEAFEATDGTSFRISQLESVVSDQLSRELTILVARWLEDRGVDKAASVFEVAVDPLIKLRETDSRGMVASEDDAALDQEFEIKRVIVEVNVADSLPAVDELAAGVAAEITATLAARGYVFQRSGEALDDSRPLAHVEVNVPRAIESVAATAGEPVPPSLPPTSAAAASMVLAGPAPSKGQAQALVGVEKALTGATVVVLTAIILLLAFVLRQVKVPKNLALPNSVTRVPPEIAPLTSDVGEGASALERGKSIHIGDSLALMNFDQALHFLGRLDRVRRRAVLSGLPVHPSIKLRLAKALEHRQGHLI